jgi:hypothetical protein
MSWPFHFKRVYLCSGRVTIDVLKTCVPKRLYFSI